MSQQTQLQFSELSSSYKKHEVLSSNLNSQSRLSSARSNNKKLHKVESKIINFMIRLRQRKIDLLQKINSIVETRISLQQNLQSEERNEINKISCLKNERDKTLVGWVQKQERLKQKLSFQNHLLKKRQIEAQKNSSNAGLDIDDDQKQITLAEQIIKFKQENDLQEGIIMQFQLQNQTASKILHNQSRQSISPEQKYQDLRQERDKLVSTINELSKGQSNEENYEDLISSLSEKNNEAKHEIEQIYGQLVFTDRSSSDLQNYVKEQQQQKRMLYEQLHQMREQLTMMKEKIKSMEKLLVK